MAFKSTKLGSSFLKVTSAADLAENPKRPHLKSSLMLTEEQICDLLDILNTKRVENRDGDEVVFLDLSAYKRFDENTGDFAGYNLRLQHSELIPMRSPLSLPRPSASLLLLPLPQTTKSDPLPPPGERVFSTLASDTWPLRIAK